MADGTAPPTQSSSPTETPTGFHIGIGGGIGAAIAGKGDNRSPLNVDLSLEASYQAEKWYVGISGLVVFGGEFEDGDLRSSLSTQMVVLRGGALFTLGPVRPFVGGGIGYVAQGFFTNHRAFDNGFPNGAVDVRSGAGAMAEAGAILLEGQQQLQVIASTRLIIPFFGFPQDGDQRFPIVVFNLQLMF